MLLNVLTIAAIHFCFEIAHEANFINLNQSVNV